MAVSIVVLGKTEERIAVFFDGDGCSHNWLSDGVQLRR